MSAVVADTLIAFAITSTAGLANGTWLHWMRGGRS